MYAIAKRFSIEARLAAMKENYLGIRCIINGETYCPLGIMLREDKKLTRSNGTPMHISVANMLLPQENSTLDEWTEICEEALEFISKWDHEEITSLREALGLEKESK